MEVGTVKPKPSIQHWFIYPLIAIVFGLLGFIIYKQGKDNDTSRQALQDELTKETALRSNCGYLKDSLLRVNTELSKYKTLSQAMLHRDEATNQLKHKVGEMVILKSDSARVVIEDVLIGG